MSLIAVPPLVTLSEPTVSQRGEPGGISSMNTIPELLARLEDQHEHCTTVYGRRGQPTDRRTHAELARLSRAIATRLLDLGFRPGEYVFLQLPSSMALIECILGAIVAGLVPCCLAPPK